MLESESKVIAVSLYKEQKMCQKHVDILMLLKVKLHDVTQVRERGLTFCDTRYEVVSKTVI